MGGVLAGDIRVGSKRGRSWLLSYVESVTLNISPRFNEFAVRLLFGERIVSLSVVESENNERNSFMFLFLYRE